MHAHRIGPWASQVLRALLGLAAATLLMGLLACAAPSGTPAPHSAAALTPEQRCASEGGTWDAASDRRGGYCAKGTAAQCAAAGGQWQRVCMLGTLACVKPYADAGKACSSGKDCQGRRCLMDTGTPGAFPFQGPLTGHCIANDNPCYFGINLENGQPVPTAVAD